MKSDQDIILEMFGAAKRSRAKPHRCIEPSCNRVTKHVRCPICTAKRRGAK